MTASGQQHVVVIGGGIIGLNITERLLHDGHRVSLVERERIAAGASYGNAAGFAFSEILPLASPATIRKSIRWFLDPLGPFAVVMKDLPQTINWLLRFALAARPAMYKRSTETLSALMELERVTLKAMLERTGLGTMVQEKGALHLYEKLSHFHRDVQYRRANPDGSYFEPHQGAALHRLQHGLSDRIVGGIFVPDYSMVTNPYDYCQAIHQLNLNNGVSYRIGTVNNIIQQKQGVMVGIEGAPSIHADKVVVAAGPWSATLAAMLGDKVPLVGERGYNTTLPKSAFPGLESTLVFAEHGFVMAPLADGIRVGGASEIASLEREPNYQRSVNMLNKAKALVPGLQTEQQGEQWMGRRPTLPDTLPVISRATRAPDVIYAFGHGHLGLTLASSTAVLVSDLIQGNEPSIDLRSLAVDRF